MKRLVFLFAITICLSAWSCDNASTNDGELAGWETELIENAAQAEDMANFLENAQIGTVGGVKYITQLHKGDKVYCTDVDGMPDGNGSQTLLFDSDGGLRAYLWYLESDGTRDYTWRVATDDPMVLICTNEYGEEQRAKLISYSAEDDFWYFEGNFPGYNDIYEGKSRYEYCVVQLRAIPDAERRAEAEARYENARAENE